MEWFTRYGTKHEGPVTRSDEAKGIASHNYMSKCGRCGGRGGADHWKFTGWTCFECGGSGSGGIKTEKLYSAEKLAKMNASQAKRDATKAVKAQAAEKVRQEAAQIARQEFYAANHEFVNALEAFRHEYEPDAPEPKDAFLANLWHSYEEHGRLSENQILHAKAAIDRYNERKAKREASQFVGKIGDRVELTLTVERCIVLESHHYGWAAPVIHLCRDEHGNRVIYKGTGDFVPNGETGRVKATIASHDCYKGENQTQLSRPKVLSESSKYDGEVHPAVSEVA